MPPKPDPYVAPLQKRINALLLVATAVVLAVLLRATTTADAASDGRSAAESRSPAANTTQLASR